MNQEKKLKEMYPTQYDMYGIYVDWLIDNNLIEGLGKDPHNIKTFEDFLGKKDWQVAEIMMNGQNMLSMDIELPKFKLLTRLGIEKKQIIKAGLKGTDTEKALQQCVEAMKLPIFDLIQYYMSHVPWDLTDERVMNHCPDKLVINLDEWLSTGRIIVKVMTTKGVERIVSANDIYHGGVEECECLIDPVARDYEASLEMEKYWSEKLGIPILGDDEEIDVNYRYPR